MKKTRVAINGFGRIGRAFYKLARTRPELEVVAVNDLGDPSNMAYLLKYDTAYGKADFDVDVVAGDEPGFIVGGQKVHLVQEKDATKLPWAKYDNDIVVESTGFFTSAEASKVHLDQGAKRVVITAPMKGGSLPDVACVTALMGINDGELAHAKISSNASCTTNAASPVICILNEKIGIEKALLNTTHAYTGTQKIVDGPGGKDLRGGRAGAQNMIPASTGAAISVTEVVPDLKGKFDGMAIRVPTIDVSLSDFTFLLKKKTTVEAVNSAFRAATKQPRYRGVLGVSDEPLVSSDLIGSTFSAVVDLPFTKVIDGDLLKVLAWYDNEWGYSHRLIEMAVAVGRSL